MHLVKKILVLLTAFLVVNISYCQTFGDVSPQYRSQHWTVNDGLAHDKVYCILKDANGFVWIGTEGGLSRFDGSTFKNFYYDPGKKNSIAGAHVFGLIEDSLHNIWIGTNMGLSRYDSKADTLSNFYTGFKTSSPFIVPFAATKNGVLCREADSAITSYNIRSFERK